MRNDILYVVMPAYNEEANIASVVKQWHSVVQKTGPESRLLIINDGSKDSTFKKLEGLREAYPLLVRRADRFRRAFLQFLRNGACE